LGSRKRVKQHYKPYWLWECYLNGMYNTTYKSDEFEALKKAIDFTGNYVEYGQAMIEVVIAWPNTMIHHLSNANIGHRSFIGHCACCYKFKWPEYIVCKAWKMLDNEQRWEANKQADNALKYWLNEYSKKNRNVRKNMGRQMLLQWHS